MRPLIASILALAVCAAADEAAKPAATTTAITAANADERVAEITVAELKELVAAKKVVAIDVNGTDSFKKAHVPGAIDFAANEADLAKLLPADKGALIVAYCGGPTCPAWKHGAVAASKLGYTNIKHLKAGISGWTEAKAPVEQVQ